MHRLSEGFAAMLKRFWYWLMPAPCDDPDCTRYRKPRPTCRNGHPQVYALGHRGPPTSPRPSGAHLAQREH